MRLQDHTYDTLHAQGHHGWGYHGRVFRISEHEAIKLYRLRSDDARVDAEGLAGLLERGLGAAKPLELGTVVADGPITLPAPTTVGGRAVLMEYPQFQTTTHVPALRREWVTGQQLGKFFPSRDTVRLIEDYFARAVANDVHIGDYNADNFLVRDGALIAIDAAWMEIGEGLYAGETGKAHERYMERQMEKCIADAFRTSGAGRVRTAVTVFAAGF